MKEDVYYPEKIEGGGHGGGDVGIVEDFVAMLKEGRPIIVGEKGGRDSAAIAIAAVESEETELPADTPLLGEKWSFLDR